MGVVGSDDVFVADAALNLIDKGWALPAEHHGARIGLWLPLVPTFAAFRTGDWQVAWFPLVCGLGIVALAFAIGQRLFGRAVGLAAGLLAATFPLDVLNSTTLYPDLPLGTVSALAFYVALRAEESRRPWLVAIAAGLLWGYAYLVKIEAAMLLFAMVALWPCGIVRFRTLAIIGATVAAVIVAENLIYYAASGEILYRLTHIAATRIDTAGTTAADLEHYGAGGLWVFPKSWFITFYDFGLHYYLMFAGLLFLLFRPTRPALLVLLWAGAFLLWLEFGGNPLAATYHFKSHLSRYCSMLSVPMAIAGAYFAVRVLGAARRWLGGAALAGVVAVAVFMCNFDQLNYETETAVKLGLHEAAAKGWSPLTGDLTTATLARFFWWHRPELAVRSIARSDIAPDGGLPGAQGYVMVSPPRLEYQHKRYGWPTVSLDWLQRCGQHLLTIGNPMPGIAYKQLEAMASLGSMIPKLGPQIQETARDVLNPNDLVAFRLPADRPAACRAG